MNFSDINNIMHTQTPLFPPVRLLILAGAFTLSAQAQEPVDITRLVFDVTSASQRILPVGPPLSEADESNTDYLSLLETIRSYEAEVDRIHQSSNNPYNYELLEQYMSLGDAHHELGRYEEAITYYDNALQIMKVQNGLHSIDQLTITEKVIQSYLAMGDLEKGTRWHEYEHYLHLHNYEPGSREMVLASNELADWYISTFFMENLQSQYLNGLRMSVLPEQERIANPLVAEQMAWSNEFNRISRESPTAYVDPNMEAIFNGTIQDLTPREVEDARLLLVGEMYEDSQQAIYDSESPDIDSIAQIARRIAGLSFITKQEQDYERINYSFIPNYSDSRIEEFRNSQQRLDHSYETGRRALRYIVNIMRTVEAPPRMVASALIELADWNLAYGKIQAARDFYEEAYEELISAGFTMRQIDSSLNLAVPRQIPRSATHRFTRRSSGLPVDAELDYRGYIDLSFEVDSLGNAQEVVFTRNDNPEYRQLERVITDYLKTAKFRPHFDNGELVSQGRVELRYYYSY